MRKICVKESLSIVFDTLKMLCGFQLFLKRFFSKKKKKKKFNIVSFIP